jgi:hypothetical protein
MVGHWDSLGGELLPRVAESKPLKLLSDLGSWPGSSGEDFP